MTNYLYYGDNIDVLPDVGSASIDLVYLDPPFNSDRPYNVIFRDPSGVEAQAQIQAFDDTWTWSNESETQYNALTQGGAPEKVANAIEGMHRLLGETNVLAYLVMMTPRLLELHRVLKPSGSLYLHCDPTASHYLKLILDAMFGPTQFRNEIIWRRTGAHSPRRSFGPVHDVILFYTKSNAYYFNTVRLPYTRQHVSSRYSPDESGRLRFTSGGNVLTGSNATGGESGMEWQGFNPSARNRHWAIPGFLAEQMPPEFQSLGVLAKLDALYEAGLIVIEPGAAWPVPLRYLRPEDGLPISDIWAYQPGTKRVLHGTDDGIDEDVSWLGPTDPERLGYPTQKPTGLLERIVKTSCPPDGIVLDPFCGCGTAVDVAQQLGRRWIGIDITFLSVDLIQKRLIAAYGKEVEQTYETRGTPRDLQSARALFQQSPFDFERWAVSLVDGTPNERQVGDRGIDGVIRFPIDGRNQIGKCLVSVKGGRQINPAMVRDLIGTVDSQHAEMGVLITMDAPTPGMVGAARTSGNWVSPVTDRAYPKVQLINVAALLSGTRPDMPTAFLPYVRARRMATAEQLELT